MEYTCVVCRKPSTNTVDVWAYANRKGGDVAYPVCVKCVATNAKHVAHIVEAINRKADREAGYK